MNTKRFNIIDDEWIGLNGAEFVTAIEDSDSPKKTVYFVYNDNVQGVADLLNGLVEMKNRCCANSHNAHQFLKCYEKAIIDIEEEYKGNQMVEQVLEKLDKYYTKYEKMVELK